MTAPKRPPCGCPQQAHDLHSASCKWHRFARCNCRDGAQHGTAGCANLTRDRGERTLCADCAFGCDA